MLAMMVDAKLSGPRPPSVEAGKLGGPDRSPARRADPRDHRVRVERPRARTAGGRVRHDGRWRSPTEVPIRSSPAGTALPGSVDLTSSTGRLLAADVVSLHVPLTAETRNILDARRLALMRAGARRRQREPRRTHRRGRARGPRSKWPPVRGRPRRRRRGARRAGPPAPGRAAGHHRAACGGGDGVDRPAPGPVRGTERQPRADTGSSR